MSTHGEGGVSKTCLLRRKMAVPLHLVCSRGGGCFRSRVCLEGRWQSLSLPTHGEGAFPKSCLLRRKMAVPLLCLLLRRRVFPSGLEGRWQFLYLVCSRGRGRFRSLVCLAGRWQSLYLVFSRGGGVSGVFSAQKEVAVPLPCLLMGRGRVFRVLST